MANNILKAPIGATRVAAKTLVESGRFVRYVGEVGEDVAHRLQPDYVSPKEAAQIAATQAILRQHVGRFGVAGLSLEAGPSEDEIEAMAETTVQSALQSKLVDDSTVLEIRPFVTEDDMTDRRLLASMSMAATILRRRFTEELDLTALTNTHAISPPRSDRPDVVTAGAWHGVGFELDGLSYQMRGDGTKPVDVAILGIARPAVAATVFRENMFSERHLENGGLAVLARVNDSPSDNVLWPAAALEGVARPNPVTPADIVRV